MVSMRSNFYKNQHGFTLIEVLVASTIVIMSLGTILQLFSSGLSQNHKVGQLAHLLSAQRTIVAKLEQINPAKQEKGKGVVQGLSYQWIAKITEPYQLVYQLENDFPREVAIYNITVDITKPRQGKYQFILQRLGWRNKE